MKPLRKHSLPIQIEETIGRRLLFRDNADETETVESIESQMKAFQAAKPTVREGMQRLLAAGVIRPGRGLSFISLALEYARGMGALELEVRCANTPDQRRRAFFSWLDCLQHVTLHALRGAMGRRTETVRLLKSEFERLTAVGYSSYDPIEMAAESVNLIWLAAKASQSDPLILMLNSLARSLTAMAPWLGAVIQNRQLGDAWMRVEAAFRAENRDKLDDAVDALFAPLRKRMQSAVNEDAPQPMEQGYETQRAG